MAHPKRKISKTRRDKRRTHFKAADQQIATCKTTGEAHLYHYDWLPPLSGLYPIRVDAASESAKLAELGAMNGIDPAHCHWTDVVINDSSPALVEEVDAEVVVMGAISRSAIDRVFVGSTAERLLDELVCDVLVVKPD